MPHPVSPLLTSYVSMVYLSQQMNRIDILLLTNVDTFFIFPLFLPNVIFLSQDPIQDTI